MSSTSTRPTYYEVLGVDPDADIEVIKRAHRRIMRENHPDLVGEAGEQITADANVAFSVLSDPERRDAYDLSLSDPEPEPEVEEEVVEDWGQEASWDEVFEEPEPQPQPEPETSTPTTPVVRSDRVRRPGDATSLLTMVFAAGVLMLVVLFRLPATTQIPYPDWRLHAAVVALPALLGVFFGLVGHAVSPPPRHVVLDSVLLSGLSGLLWFGWSHYLTIAAAVLIVFSWNVRALRLLRAYQNACDRAIDPATLAANNVYGSNDSPESTFVENLLTDLYDIPGVRIIRIPGAGYGLTHVVAYGPRMLLVGLAPAAGQPYRWTRNGLRSGKSLVMDQRWMSVRDSILRTCGRASLVGTYLVVDSPAVSLRPSPTASPARLITPDQLTERVTDFIGPRPHNIVDQRLMAEVLSAF